MDLWVFNKVTEGGYVGLTGHSTKNVDLAI